MSQESQQNAAQARFEWVPYITVGTVTEKARDASVEITDGLNIWGLVRNQTLVVGDHPSP